ncbi:FIG01060185: hypothetical protein [uncultured Candidatus Thioglobus sp.]|nr:FIG01060185: hypothetical protein [uncultured Candidatus Thioglobus sp.]
MKDLTININQRYKSSAKIDSKVSGYKPFIDDFILHGTAINILDTLSRDFAGNAQRAYTITGPYGSGKSTLVLYLSSLLATNKAERTYAYKKLEKAEGKLEELTSRFCVKNGWKVIKHVCGLESPANAILSSILTSLDIEFDDEQLQSLDDEACLAKIKLALSPKREDIDGILFLVDELGKALDYQSREGKDLHLFQSLADIVQQAETSVMFIGILHQSFSDYAKNKDAKAQKEWAKVQGRYRDLSFNPSIDESLTLVGDSISKNKELTLLLESKHKQTIDDVLLAFPNQGRNAAALLNTLPLDPLVSLLLGPISRRRFSQNERSLFGFLASHEKFGFREFLETNYLVDQQKLALYESDKLWNYLHHNSHHLIITSHDSKAWLEACDAIYRAGQKGGDLHISITKVISLLTIFGFQHHLHAKRSFIEQYFLSKGFKNSDITQAIADLETWTVVIYRQKHDALFVFQGSDIDIQNLILERIESVSHGVDWTTVCNQSQSILATAHYHKTGTMRWANTLLVNNLDFSISESLTTEPLTGEAFLTFLLPVNVKAAKKISAISKQSAYVAIGDLTSLDDLKSAAIELIALSQIEKDEKKITHDLIAKAELENRIKTANLNVEKQLQIAFKAAKWHHKNEPLESVPLSAIASTIADKVYNGSPTVINELVNRSKPSGSANSAIRKLMNAMLESGDKEDLGFDKDSFPPEKSLYLSCLKSKGWHLYTQEGYTFPQSWKKDAKKANLKMYGLWKDGVHFIKSRNDMITLDELYTHWMKPPFGLTSGLCRIYGLALLKSLEGQVAFYDLDSTKQFIFIPELDEELVTKIYKHPVEAGVRYFEISKIQTHLLDTLAKATLGTSKPDNAVLGIAKHIVKIVHTLPAWVKKTSGESFFQANQANGLTKEARTFRNKVISANDPYKLILDDLPNVFELNIDDKKLDERLAYCLKAAINDLSAQHDMLLSGFKQIITSQLAAEFDDDLISRCEQVVTAAQRPSIKELATRLIKFIRGKATFELVINLATGVPERNWTDKHLRNGLDELQNLCTQFRRIESFNNINGNPTTQPVALITTDSNGKYKEYSGFIKFGLEKDTDVKSAFRQVESTLSNLPKEKQLATLTKILSTIMTNTEPEAAHD